jgi:hypothetical protein
MATVKRIVSKTSPCKCGKEQLTLEIDKPFEMSHLQLFVNSPFSEVSSYTKLGLLYLESKDLVAIGTFGTNRIQVKCKNNYCVSNIKELEDILRTI